MALPLFSRSARSDCHRAARFLQHYLDGELDMVRSAMVAEHLETCRRCGLEARTYQSIKVAISAAAPHSDEADAAAVARLRDFADTLAKQEE
ncbi:zf-HC2 domain-containing protein [Demequina sp.]|uniref:anti-sigma factor family protein n=1 Tax=Demequina sp. TaxID=2050685 RepID=UPI0025C22A58|nr:zf-HC2 domain-containing protein [Demequina sp.]